MPAIQTDGDIPTGPWRRVEANFPHFYWLLVDQSQTFAITARAADGTTVTATLPGVTAEQRKANRNEAAAPNLSLRFIKDPQIAEIRIRSFDGDDYRAWMERTFRSLRDKGTKSLVIDLRGNGGGEDGYGALLVAYLTDKPFRYFDHIRVKTVEPSFMNDTDLTPDDVRHLREGTAPDLAGGGSLVVTPTFSPEVALQQPAPHPFLGKTIVLINGRTFSTAADFCAVAHHLHLATFVGEETGGAYYGNNSGEMPDLTLPNSKLRVRIPLFEYWNAVPGYPHRRRGVMPDVEVATTPALVLRGVDEQLDAAVKLAERM
jgi:C-terminal processing protease CtpA/Prc